MKKILPFVILAIFCVVFWNILHFIYTFGFTDSAYSFSAFRDVCLPAVIGVTVGMITGPRQKQR